MTIFETLMSDLPLEVLRGIHKKLTDIAPEIETELSWQSVHWQVIQTDGVHSNTVLQLKEDGIEVSYYPRGGRRPTYIQKSCDVFFSFNDEKVITKSVCTFIMMANAANGIY